MTDRDHFAAAALTGFASQPRFNCGSVLTLTAKQCYELADAMLRERERTNLDAAPAAIASVESVAPQPTTHGESDRTDKAARRPSEGTGDTPEPVAWAVAGDYGEYAVALFSDKESAQTEADRRALVGFRPDYVIVPLYRKPPCQDSSQKNLTLTDCERGAIERAVDSIASTMPYESQQGLADWKTLRGLLRRMGGVR